MHHADGTPPGGRSRSTGESWRRVRYRARANGWEELEGLRPLAEQKGGEFRGDAERMLGRRLAGFWQLGEPLHDWQFGGSSFAISR